MEDEKYNTENLEKNKSIKKPRKEKCVKIIKADKPNADNMENHKKVEKSRQKWKSLMTTLTVCRWR